MSDPDPELEPAAALHKSGDISESVDSLQYPAFEGLYAASDIIQLIEKWIEKHDEEHKEIIECEDEDHDHEILEPMAVGRKQSLENLKSIIEDSVKRSKNDDTG